MKTKILPIIALLALAAFTMVPSDKVKVPNVNFGKLKSAFSKNDNNPFNSNGARGREGVIQTMNEKVKMRQIRPGRHDENDHWGYDNKYYRKVDRNYQLNILDDLKLENKNIRGLLGRSKVDINLYNKGLFNSGYNNVEILVIAYDEYGDYLGERIEIMPHCICKSEDSRERLGISRNTDEVIVKILHAEPCTCRDWYEKATRKKEKVQKRVNSEIEREKEKQYKKWERESSKNKRQTNRSSTYNKNRQSSNKQNTYNRDRQSSNRQKTYDRDRESSSRIFPIFGRNRSNQSSSRQVVYDNYDDDYYEEPKQKKQKKEKPPKEKKQKGIPADVRISERGPIHIDFCDCRKCLYQRPAPTYEFSRSSN